MTGYWKPFDLMTVRDAAIADIVPSMSDFQGVPFADGRLPYNLGHAAFEFIESRWGKEGLRQFLFALRKSVIGGGESAYEEAFRLKPEEFDEQFDKYLKDRFKPFRDKERPADYGRDLAPKRDKTPYVVGRLDRAVAVGRPDGRRRRQPQGSGARHRPDVDQGRQGHPQPDRAASTRTAASSTSRRPAASATTRCRGCRGRRPAIASPTSRAPRSTRRSSSRTSSRGRSRSGIELKTVDVPGVARHQPGRQGGRVRRRCAAPSATSSSSTSRPARSRTSPTTQFGDYAPT